MTQGRLKEKADNRGSYNQTQDKHEFALPAGIPDPVLRLTDDEKVIRSKLIESLKTVGAVSKADGLAFDMLVKTIVNYNKASIDLANEDFVLYHPDDPSKAKVHPIMTVWEKLNNALIKQLTDFGLTPAGRAKVPVKPSEEEKGSKLANIIPMPTKNR